MCIVVLLKGQHASCPRENTHIYIYVYIYICIYIYKYMVAVSPLKHEDNSSQPIQDFSAHCRIKKSTWSGEMPNTPWFPAKSVKFQISVRFISAAVTFAAPKTLNSDELHILIGYIFIKSTLNSHIRAISDWWFGT